MIFTRFMIKNADRYKEYLISPSDINDNYIEIKVTNSQLFILVYPPFKYNMS